MKKPIHPYALTSFILALLTWIPLINVFTNIIAIIFGTIALKELKTDKSHKGRGLAIAGISIGLISILLFLAGMVVYPEVYFNNTFLMPN